MSVQVALAYVCLAWYAVVLSVALVGLWCLLTVFKKPPTQHPNFDWEPVTIIRPIKGIDPELTSCLELLFLQKYPREKLQILFCVYDQWDPAVSIVQRLIEKHPEIDAQILVSEPGEHHGPNPKVNNLAKGFLAAKHDILWIMDSNVWASPNILANSVVAMTTNSNCGKRCSGRKVKLVHHVPLALSLDLLGGALLDEMFLFTSHLKFYVALNNISIAPCVNGKSNMYRKSDLDHAVRLIPHNHCAFFHEQLVVQDAARISALGKGHSIGFFAKYIGEDNMIGIALWEYCFGRTALTGDVVIQPVVGQINLVREYFSRRVRWLRVRKYMVLAATLVEPTTELLLCGVMGTFAVSTLFFGQKFNMWFFGFHMTCWVICDYIQYYSWVRNIDLSKHLPEWLQDISPLHRSVWQWFQVWIMREVFALPIWIAAMVGHEIEWRGKPFKIKKDLLAEEL